MDPSIHPIREHAGKTESHMIKVTAAIGNGTAVRADAVSVGFFEKDKKNKKGKTDSRGRGIPPGAGPLDRALNGALSAAMKSGDLAGKPGEIHTLYPTGSPDIPRAVLLGLGSRTKVKSETLRRAAGNLGRHARKLKLKRVVLVLPALKGKKGVEKAAAAMTEGFVLGAYRVPSRGKSKAGRPGRKNRKTSLPALTVLARDAGALPRVRTGVRYGMAVAHGAWLVRDLVNRPGNELQPRGLAAEARKLARSQGLACKVMGKADLVRIKAGGILAVGQGSAHPPCLIQIEYRGGKANAPTVCLVGKGITFDTGGISLKPSQNMDRMKYDMSGAAAVLGILSAARSLKLPLNVVGVIAAAENMPGPAAYKPGDIITQLDGTTVEVVNTDAEGRIVLGDALAWAVKKKPDALVDLATLTGACAVALGSQAVAMMANDDDLAGRMESAGVKSGERVWRLPLWKEYRRLLTSDVADQRNAGGREAGTIAAGMFLETFVDAHPWVHLDIASTAWSEASREHRSKGGTGVGVALVTRFLAEFSSRG